MASEKVVRGLAVVFVCLLGAALKAEVIADFEDLGLQAQSYWNGSDGSGGFSSGNAWFYNHYDVAYGSWAGFAYSNISNTTAQGWSSQYNAITGAGQAGSANYAVGYGYESQLQPPTMVINEPTVISGLYVTNNNYAYYSMRNGDMFAKKFGGPTGNDADWFLLTMTGKDAAGAITGTVDFYLADFRFADNQLDYIVNNWRFADLTSLGEVKSVEFGLSSSDMGDWGMNTPGYFVLDTVVPEPATVVLMGFGVMGVLMRYRVKREA